MTSRDSPWLPGKAGLNAWEHVSRERMDDDIEKWLKSYSFSLHAGQLYETVVSAIDTENSSGVNVTPVGVRFSVFKEHEDLQASFFLYPSSRLHDLLGVGSPCIVHLVPSSLSALFLLAFKEELPAVIEDFVLPHLKRSPACDVPYLDIVPNFLEGEITSTKEIELSPAHALPGSSSDSKTEYTMRISSVIIRDPFNAPVSRLEGLALEYMIQATRLKYFGKNDDRRAWIEKTLEELLSTMRRVDPSSHWMEKLRVLGDYGPKQGE